MDKKEVLVIGAGGAALSAAIEAHEKGASVRIITKEYPTRSQTCMAQGGINAALGNAGEDSVAHHIADTLRSGQGLSDEKAVEFLCQSAPDAIRWLDSIGVCFSRTNESTIAQRALGGAYAARACYAQDYTGLKILHALYDKVLSYDIEMLNERFLLELVVEDSTVKGAQVLNIRTGEIESYGAKAVIMATGGYSKIYNKNSTNSSASTGDGLAVAQRAGAKLKHMEFVQFHPTGLKNSSILISESARGAGGYLINSDGERFVDELLPRDKVARAIDAEIKKGQEVFLDIRHLGEEFIDEELPQERKLAKLYENVDPVDEIVPIKPVAHYTMGGIEVDDDSMTSVKGLYAAGECANHNVHGGNRLGGNSLLEIVVFGKQAGRNAAAFAKSLQEEFNNITPDISLPESGEYPYNFYDYKAEIGNLFYEKVGIVRSKKQLEEALQRVEEIQEKLPQMGPSDLSEIHNSNRVEFLEFINVLQVAKEIVTSALAREESCGAHYRID